MWPFQRQPKFFYSWPIVRTKPFRRTYGRAILAFINNWQCHLTSIDVYADGTVDCWGLVDLPSFQHKLDARWIVCAPKPDQPISVFNLGLTTAREAKWHHTADDLAREVMAAVKTLNPSLTELFDIQQHTRTEHSQGRSAKIGPSDQQPYRTDGPEKTEILGDSVPVFRVREGRYEITRLFLFSDGSVQLDANRPLLSLRHLEEQFQRGELTNLAPAHSRIIVPGLGEFTTSEPFGGLSTPARIAELQDKLKVLKGEPSVVTLCLQALDEYRQKPSADLKEALRLAYNNVPEHLRKYCGDMDTKDASIRQVLTENAPAHAPPLALPFDKL